MRRKPLKIAISACLLGVRVRYDGRDRRVSYLVHTLGAVASYLPFCPETGAGLPTPREPIRLTGDPAAPRALGRESGTDYTDVIATWSEAKLREFEAAGLWAVVLKARSPSCGPWAEVSTEERKVRRGAGLFADALTRRFPLIPVEDEERLWIPAVREHFIARIFLLKRWRDMKAGNPTRAALVDFHSRHKLTLMSMSPSNLRALGRVAADPTPRSAADRIARYETELLTALRHRATRAKNANVLQHVLGYFKRELSEAEKREFLASVEDYRNRLVPLIVPVTLANHWVNRFGQPYLGMQTYLKPDPLELKLRCHG